VPGPYRIETLGSHDRTKFYSGSEALDRYFRQIVAQDVRRRATACFVALDAGTDQIAGYYTLSASGIPLNDVPAPLVKKLPRYPSVPVARLGRLAVDRAYQGQQLGAGLLWDAACRAARSEVAVFALVVDAKDDHAASFYLHHGFAAFGSTPRQFICALANFLESRL